MRSDALETLTTCLASPLLSKSMIKHKRQASRFDQENTPPPDPNVPTDRSDSVIHLKNSTVAKAELPKAKLDDDPVANGLILSSADSSAKVVVRIRPVNATEEGLNRIVQKISPNSLSVKNKTFTFDSVIGPGSTQEDVFQLVGSSLVKDSLAGFNTSILCYGETGSGKSYTMWGPLSSMLEEHSAISSQGIATRIFLEIFSEIQALQQNAEDKMMNFQCRCSLLEIYNEQISDLLDPTQRNLEIKDDPRNGFYVENLSEEYVNGIEDVMQVLVKGLSNRRVGSTSANSKSSRSHVILTCIIESWCKATASQSINSSKTSRINLVDLAGSESSIPDGASGRYKKEGRHIKKSLSKLGKLINELAEATRSGKIHEISHANSSLTHLLREPLGGNAKTTFICTVSPIEKCKTGTLSTLRFAQQAKFVDNNAVMNEITEDHVNDLSDQIRQLKEELIREKTCSDKFPNATHRFFRRHNARGSLNLLRASLNRSLILPHIDSEAEEEFVDAHDGDVKELCEQLSTLQSSLEKTTGIRRQSLNHCSDEVNKEDNVHIINDTQTAVHKKFQESISDEDAYTDISDSEPPCSEIYESLTDAPVLDSVSVSPSSRQSLVFQEPTLCSSPKINPTLKKSLCVPEGPADSERQQSCSGGQVLLGRGDHVRSSMQSSKLSPTDCLAASLHRGLQIIECHQQRSVSRSSLVGFSFDYLKNSSQFAGRSDVSLQTLTNDECRSSGNVAPFICASCKQMEENSNKHVTPGDNNDKAQNSEINSRVAELEKICEDQATLIKDLNIQVEQLKQHNEQKCTKEITTHDIEIKEILIGECKNELPKDNNGQSTAFGLVEGRSALLEEIKSLRSQLEFYNGMPNSKSLQEDKCEVPPEYSQKNADDFEKERQRWTESESRWICLTEELRFDLESHRRLAEKKDSELASEKRCSEELDDALQRAIIGHSKMIEHYAELQEKYTHLLDQHRQIMEGIAQVKKAAAKAGKKGVGSAFANALNAELCKERSQREKERSMLREQNRVLKIQLRDTAEAVHAAGELLVKLREAEETTTVAEEKYGRAAQEVERLRKQMDKMKKKHLMEMEAVKQYMAESRLPGAALEPLFRQEHEADQVGGSEVPVQYDTQSWRAAFEPSYR